MGPHCSDGTTLLRMWWGRYKSRYGLGIIRSPRYYRYIWTVDYGTGTSRITRSNFSFPSLLGSSLFLDVDCNLFNRHLWRCMLLHAERQVLKNLVFCNTLFHHVCYRRLCSIFYWSWNGRRIRLFAVWKCHYLVSQQTELTQSETPPTAITESIITF